MKDNLDKQVIFKEDFKDRKFKREEILTFWGISEYLGKSAGKVGNRGLSQWAPSLIKSEGIYFTTAEQLMMYKKAILFEDIEIANRILKTNNPKSCKALGRKVSNFDPNKWDEHKFRIVVEINRQKFQQNPKLMKYLISTGDKILIEASPYDKIWGVGLTDKDEDILITNKWLGENLLGFALMQVRDYIIKDNK